MSMKNFSDNIGNRTRDLQACSAVAKTLRHRDSPRLYSAWLQTASHLNTQKNSVKTHGYPKRKAPFRGTLWWLSTVLPDDDKCDVPEHVADLPTSDQHISGMCGLIYTIYLFNIRALTSLYEINTDNCTHVLLTFWRRNYFFFNFSTSGI